MSQKLGSFLCFLSWVMGASLTVSMEEDSPRFEGAPSQGKKRAAHFSEVSPIKTRRTVSNTSPHHESLLESNALEQEEGHLHLSIVPSNTAAGDTSILLVQEKSDDSQDVDVDATYKEGCEAWENRNFLDAIKLFKLSVKKGNVSALNALILLATEKSDDSKFPDYTQYKIGKDIIKKHRDTLNSANSALFAKCFYRAFKNGYKDSLSELTDLANEGNIKAKFWVWEIYKYGEDEIRDENMAEKYYKQCIEAASKGSKEAQYIAGKIYLGEGKSDRAIDSFNKAAQQRHWKALKRLEHSAFEKRYIKAQCYLVKLYSRRNTQYDEAFKFLFQAAAQQENEESSELDNVNGDEDEDLRGKARDLLDTYSRKGDSSAQYYLGELYYLEKKLGEAIENFYNAAQKGHLGALKKLEALAYEQKNVRAQYCLSSIYLENQGETQNLEKAFELLDLASRQGDENALKKIKEWAKKIDSSATAQYYLGRAYKEGINDLLPKNSVKAVKLFYKAARQNHEESLKCLKEEEATNPYAQFYLGKYYRGSSKTKDTPLNVVELFASAARQKHRKAFKELKKLAKKKIFPAQFYLAGIYEKGGVVTQNFGKVIKWYEKAINQKPITAPNSLCYRPITKPQLKITAQYNLALLYMNMKKDDTGVEKNLPRAIKLLIKVSGQGLNSALKQSALKELESLAANNVPEAQFKLGELYEKDPEEKDPEEKINKVRQIKRLYYNAAKQGHPGAFEKLKNSAQYGDCLSQFYLGEMYRVGNGVKKDEAEAVKFYIKAVKKGDERVLICLKILADKGNINAQFEIGLIYDNPHPEGDGNPQEALKYFRMAANKGHREAQYQLGNSYSRGGGVEKDLDEAFKWYAQAIEQGHQGALSSLIELDGNEDNQDGKVPLVLGHIYASGKFFQDKDKSVDWYANALRQGNKEALQFLKTLAKEGNLCNAQFQLGFIYGNKNQGVEIDHQKAVKYYEMAANQDHKVAQHNLGVRYFKGRGVEKDIDEAIKWHTRASQQDYKDSRDALIELAEGGNIKAQIALAFMYANEGGFRNKQKAAEEFIKAGVSPENYYLLHRALIKEEATALLQISNRDLHDLFSKIECHWLNGKRRNNDEYLKESKGLVVLTRGIHFVTNLFDEESRQENIDRGEEKHPLVVSSAGYALTGTKFLLPSTNLELENGLILRGVLKRFKTTYPDSYNIYHQIYSNTHDKFHEILEGSGNYSQKEKGAFEDYKRVFKEVLKETGSVDGYYNDAVIRNPYVSLSCKVLEALKYACGLKKFTGGESVILLPEYGEDGTPKNPFLGRLYIAFLSPEDMCNLDPLNVIAEHAQGHLVIETHPCKNILPEEEISFFGYLPNNLIEYSCPIDVPDFSPKVSPEGYKEKFGLTEKKYQKYRSKIIGKEYSPFKDKSSFEKGILNNIVEFLSRYYEEKIEFMVREKARIRIYPDLQKGYYTSISDANQRKNVSMCLGEVQGPDSSRGEIFWNVSKSKSPFTKEGVSLLASNLNRNSIPLQGITFYDQEIQSSADYFCRILENPVIRLSKLYLYQCGLNIKDIKLIAKCLSTNKILLELKLDRNKVGNKGAQAFAESLITNKTLTHLSLQSTGIENVKCFVHLFQGKTLTNQALKYLELEGNPKLFPEIVPKNQNPKPGLKENSKTPQFSYMKIIINGLLRNRNAELKA